MRRAGYAVAQFCAAHFKCRSVCIVCGRGNNGGYGLAAAEALQGIAATIHVIILAASVDELNADAASMCSRLSVTPIWIAKETDFESHVVKEAFGAELILDAIAGAGFQPPLESVARKAVEAINDAFGTVVSVDLPSGIEADIKAPVHPSAEDIVFPHGIITFIAPKPAHIFGELTAGPIVVSEIGAQPTLVSNQTSLQVVTGQEVGIAFPPRQPDAHKGQFGHILVIGGSLGKAGAAGLAGLAALRTGAGLVTVACPRSIQATVAGFAPELMTEGLDETPQGTVSIAADERVAALLAGKDVIVLGPGLSTNQQTAEFVRRLVASFPLPMVLDADGLNAFAGRLSELKPTRKPAPFRVLTPHPGEAARLVGVSVRDIQANRLETARRIAHETGSCVALKGWRTAVAGASGETWINMSGSPALAKAGSGDVLSGMIGAALAQRVATCPAKQSASATSEQEAPLTTEARIKKHQERQLRQNAAQASEFLHDVSVAAAVYLHGLAGDLARDELHENAVLATDLLKNVAAAFCECELQMNQSLFYLQR